MNIAVVGVGKLGSIHARIYRQILPSASLYLCDIDEMRGRISAETYGAGFVKDYRDLGTKVDLVSIATPTSTHFRIADYFLKRGISCLIEKPITADSKQAEQLLKTAKKKRVFLMTGMIERFNTGYQKVKKIIRNPRFIECHRLSPYPKRSLDISVILDLMIHDLDIILDLVGKKVSRIEPIGVKVLSRSADIANVRLNFTNGCIANITSSRVSDEKVRKIRIFFASSYISLDYAAQFGFIYQKKKGHISKEELILTPYEPLKKEIEYFLSQAQRKRFDYSIAEQSIDALKLALQIEKLI